MDIQQPKLSRQRFLGGVGVGGVALGTWALSACATYGEDSSSGDTASETSSPGSAAASEPGSASAAAPNALASTADVPVGSGIIVGDIVLTQPNSGEFKGFSNVCTHAGCTVNAVSDGAINCPCHGSKFNLDGTVAQGPATAPLESKSIVVQGDSILAG